MADSLDDDAVYDRLHKALLALGREGGKTRRGDTAIRAARKVLQLLQLGLIAAIDAGGNARRPTSDGEKLARE